MSRSFDQIKMASIKSVRLDLAYIFYFYRRFFTMTENYTLSENVCTVKNRSFDAVKCTIKFIRTNYERKISLDEVAKNAFMDKYTLSREFKKVTGQTIVQYINSYRCKKAAEYIISGCSVSESARICGFTNMSFFTKTFKLCMGKMPSKYKTSR